MLGMMHYIRAGNNAVHDAGNHAGSNAGNHAGNHAGHHEERLGIVCGRMLGIVL